MHGVYNKPLSKTEKRRLWDEVIQDFLSSAQTMKAYSEQHELNPDHLAYYVSRYKRQHQAPTDFIPITLPSMPQMNEIRVVIKEMTVYVPLTLSAAQLQLIFGQLKSL